LSAIFRLAILTSIVLIVGRVLITYGANETLDRPRFDAKFPAASAEQILIWLGVVVFSWSLRRVARTYVMLAETSATVGEWYLRRYAPNTLAALHPRLRD
jgi:hypothetical protein